MGCVRPRLRAASHWFTAVRTVGQTAGISSTPLTAPPDPLEPARRGEHLFVHPFGYLAEDLQTALLAEALNPLRDVDVARVTQRALLASIRHADGRPTEGVPGPDELLHPMLLTGPSKPDMLLVGEDNEGDFSLTPVRPARPWSSPSRGR